MAEDQDDTVYCDIQMPVEQGRELLQLVKTLHDSASQPSFEQVLIDMERELTDSIDILDNPPSWGFWKHCFFSLANLWLFFEILEVTIPGIHRTLYGLMPLKFGSLQCSGDLLT